MGNKRGQSNTTVGVVINVLPIMLTYHNTTTPTTITTKSPIMSPLWGTIGGSSSTVPSGGSTIIITIPSCSGDKSPIHTMPVRQHHPIKPIAQCHSSWGISSIGIANNKQRLQQGLTIRAIITTTNTNNNVRVTMPGVNWGCQPPMPTNTPPITIMSPPPA